VKRNSNDASAGREIEPSPRTAKEETPQEYGPFGNHTDSAFDSAWFAPPDVDLESIT
jgi:hypothetical protein